MKKKIKVTYSSTNEKKIEDVIKSLIASHSENNTQYNEKNKENKAV